MMKVVEEEEEVEWEEEEEEYDENDNDNDIKSSNASGVSLLNPLDYSIEFDCLKVSEGNFSIIIIITTPSPPFPRRTIAK